MRARTWEQITLQHRDDAPSDDGPGKDDDAGDNDGVFDADDLLEQQNQEEMALSQGAWSATCEQHRSWTGEPRASFAEAEKDAADHDDQFHDGNATATVSP